MDNSLEKICNMSIPRRKKSQKKINDLIQLARSWELVNANTWEYITDEEFTMLSDDWRVYVYYKYVAKNRNMDLNTKLYNELGVTYYGYMSFIVDNIKSDNSIDLNVLWLSESATSKLKWKLKKIWAIKRGNFGKESKYYLNPLIALYYNRPRLELIELFKDSPLTLEHEH